MFAKKCKRCGKISNETAISYHRRTRDFKNKEPYVCRECLRVTGVFFAPKEPREAKESFALADLDMGSKRAAISIPYLQRKYKMTHEQAKKTFETAKAMRT